MVRVGDDNSNEDEDFTFNIIYIDFAAILDTSLIAGFPNRYLDSLMHRTIVAPSEKVAQSNMDPENSLVLEQVHGYNGSHGRRGVKTEI